MLETLGSCTFFLRCYHISRTRVHSSSIPFTWRRSLGLWMAFCFTHFPLRPFPTISQSEEEFDNKTNSISFPPYLEVFVGILRFLWTHRYGFWTVTAQGCILTKICLSPSLHSEPGGFLLQWLCLFPCWGIWWIFPLLVCTFSFFFF